MEAVFWKLLKGNGWLLMEKANSFFRTLNFEPETLNKKCLSA